MVPITPTIFTNFDNNLFIIKKLIINNNKCSDKIIESLLEKNSDKVDVGRINSNRKSSKIIKSLLSKSDDEVLEK